MIEEKLEHFVMDIAIFFPQTIIDWFDLTDANILFLQYMALVLPVVAFVVDYFTSRRVIYVGGKPGNPKIFSNILKFCLMAIVIVVYDEVIRQYLPLSLSDTFNSSKLSSEYVLSLFLINFLSVLSSGINLMLFKKSTRRIRIAGDVSGVSGAYFKIAIPCIAESLTPLLNSATVMFYAVVVYYNYCM